MLETIAEKSKRQPPMPDPIGPTVHDVEEELRNAFRHMFLSVVRVDLKRDIACILFSKDRPENVGKEFPWREYFEWYSVVMTEEDRRAALENFSSEQLLARMKRGERLFEVDVAFEGMKEKGRREWLNLQAVLDCGEAENPHAYVLARSASEEHLRDDIIQKYVYNKCDYFIYLDAKNNRYTMFSGSSSGTPLPPTECLDYSSEIVKYARNYVVSEDQEMVIREMQISRIQEVLSHKEVHSFSCGVKDPVYGYTRKRLDYRYHDREHQMILLSRSDVTDLWEEEQKHNQKLQEALLRAQTDSLTGLFNYQGTVDQITDSLSCGQGEFAFMFIDLDNFKAINDTMSHSTGDELLRRVARIIRANIREMDLAGRIGGDEFVVFLRRIGSKEEAAGIAERICEGVAKATNDLQLGLSVSCSIGISLAPRDGTDYQTLAKRADELMYRSKQAGKNRYTI